jgi:hypothetical protein
MLDQPGVAVGHQGVAITTEVVEPDMGDDGEIRRHLGLVGSQCGEQDVGDVVPNDRLDVCGDRDVFGDATEERDDLGTAAQWLGTANLENAVFMECLGEPVDPAGVTRSVVSGQGVADLLTGRQLPHLHRRDSSPDPSYRVSHSTLVRRPAPR